MAKINTLFITKTAAPPSPLQSANVGKKQLTRFKVKMICKILTAFEFFFYITCA